MGRTARTALFHFAVSSRFRTSIEPQVDFSRQNRCVAQFAFYAPSCCAVSADREAMADSSSKQKGET